MKYDMLCFKDAGMMGALRCLDSFLNGYLYTVMLYAIALVIIGGYSWYSDMGRGMMIGGFFMTILAAFLAGIDFVGTVQPIIFSLIMIFGIGMTMSQGSE